MKRLYKLLLTVLVLTPFMSRAQDKTQSSSFTLEQCVQYALDNSTNVQNSRIEEEIAIAKVRETRGVGLPQIAASGSLVNNPKLPRFFTTYTGEGGFIDLSKVPNIENGDVVAAKNFFQLQASGGLNVTANQMIFNGSYFVGLRAAKTYKEFSIKATNQTKEATVQTVMKAYYSVLIAKERLALVSGNISRYDSLLRNTKALNKGGFIEEIDVDRLQVNYNNLLVQRDNLTKYNEVTVELLKFQMNYPEEQSLDVVGDVKELQVALNLDTYNQDWDIKNRPDYQVLEVNKKLQELSIRNLYATGMPTLNAFATYGYQTQSPNISGLFKTNSKIKDEGGVGPDKYYDYSQYGLSLNIPIFSGLQRQYKLQQEKLKLLQIENRFVSLKNQAGFEIKNTAIAYQNSINTLETQKANQELAGKVAHVTKIKYEQGVGSNNEVIDAESSLQQAQNNYYGALYDAMIAKIDLDKAYGKLLPQIAANDK